MSAQENKCPFHLEGRTVEGSFWLVPITTSPFVIGRKEGCNLYLAVDGISRVHAKMMDRDGAWWIEDCGSTNGTFVNRVRLTGEQKIKQGDVLQFADMHFTVIEMADSSDKTRVTNPHARQFESMMAEKAVTPYFQSIVRLSDVAVVGHEILGRVHYEGLPELPLPLFQIAARLDRAVELSQLFREQAFAQASRMGVQGILFFNLLPAEMDPDSLRMSLSRTRKDFPSLRLAMELHESVVADLPMMRSLRQVLRQLCIFLVDDDFGSGQARLVELLEVPPDVIKFDISLIHGIDTRPAASQAIVAALVKMAREAGIKTVAEGVETAQEANVCRRMGFDMAQGYYFGRPAPLAGGGLNGSTRPTHRTA
jgi:EAL domain-containing protein (putative c-di-GMP-specific phosphodiesterase class I)